MRTFIGLTMAAGLLALGACNTVAGAGQDVSSAGNAVTHAAKPAN